MKRAAMWTAAVATYVASVMFSFGAMLALAGLGGCALGADLKIGDCVQVLPSSAKFYNQREPVGFFIGRVGLVTQFMVEDPEARSLKVARVVPILHFMEEPTDYAGTGWGFRPKYLRRIKCPADFKITPYGFDAQALVDALELVDKVLDAIGDKKKATR